MASQRLLSSLCREFCRSAELIWDRCLLLIATVAFAKVCGETQFAGLQIGVNDANPEARLVLQGSTSSLRFEGAFERGAAHSKARCEAHSMPCSHASVRHVQVQPHRARTMAGGGSRIG